jgi:carbamoyl-phosphate synthase large subunit
MVNCNPETVSTDYDTSDRLFFEPLTLEDVLEIVHVERPDGIIVQYGGQTPLKLARDLEAAGAPIIGTSPESIDLAEDRERFQRVIHDLGLHQPPNCTARTGEEAARLAAELGYPLVVRPSYVLGGRAMEIVYGQDDLEAYMRDAVAVSHTAPVLLDRFLDDAVEVDVDALSDGHEVLVGGVMEHIEQAGVHSGDSACSLPPCSLSPAIQAQIREQTRSLARHLNVVGLMNVQFAIQRDRIYILEVNPRASRTVPFVSKATGVALARLATRCMLGEKLADQNVAGESLPEYFSVKEAVFPFVKFPGVDTLLGPEMKSTGEVMGVGRNFGEAFAKALLAAGDALPTGGSAFISVKDRDKADCVEIGRDLVAAGFQVVATTGTRAALVSAGVPCTHVNKVLEGRPHVVDMLKNGGIDLIVNTTEGRQAIADSFDIRRTAVHHKVPYTTTMAGARAMVMAIRELGATDVNCLQDLHREVAA